MQNLLTFDLEDWYHGNFVYDDSISIKKTDRIVEPTEKILRLLKSTNNKATFFVLGCAAAKFPHLIRKIYDEGHEIASHGFNHNLVYKLSGPSFAADVKRSIEILEKIIKNKIIGYRAPYWSLNRNMDWAFEILHENGILYDSSIYPFKTYLYGDSQAPRFRHEIRLGSSAVIELPPSTLSFFRQRLPFSGGFYFRLLPYKFTRWSISKINKKEKEPVVFYLHPYEMDINKPRSSKGFRNNFILEANVHKAEDKLKRLLRDFQFVSIRTYLANTVN